MLVKVVYCVLLSYLNYKRFGTQEMCDESVEVQIKHIELINKIQKDIINLFILSSIWWTPFLSKFFEDFLISSISLAVQLFVISMYAHSDEKITLFEIPVWIISMFAVSYFIRSVLT